MVQDKVGSMKKLTFMKKMPWTRKTQQTGRVKLRIYSPHTACVEGGMLSSAYGGQRTTLCSYFSLSNFMCIQRSNTGCQACMASTLSYWVIVPVLYLIFVPWPPGGHSSTRLHGFYEDQGRESRKECIRGAQARMGVHRGIWKFTWTREQPWYTSHCLTLEVKFLARHGMSRFWPQHSGDWGKRVMLSRSAWGTWGRLFQKQTDGKST